MSIDTDAIAAFRFGTGFSPSIPTPSNATEILASLDYPDDMVRRYPLQDLTTTVKLAREFTRQRRSQRLNGAIDRLAMRKTRDPLFRATNASLIATVMRSVETSAPMRERLVGFWADHFTVRAKSAALSPLPGVFVDDAIRPHVLGRFSDLLRAAVTHPVMLLYLDQIASVGPESPVGKRRNRGLNENLAREVLELHTLGDPALYSQSDVREFAELLTGLSYAGTDGMVFRPRIAEPGIETILGKTYGGKRSRLADIYAALDDLARHPATARHVARKLAVHFVSDTPEPALVSHLEARFAETGGNLRSVIEAFLEHPAGWQDAGAKARRPLEFLQAGLRALAPDPSRISQARPRQINAVLRAPLSAMGQPFEEPPGPDGWPETFSSWIHPQGLAARIQWSMAMPRVVRPDLPDPRDFVRTALGSLASAETRFAANSAETRWEGIGLILASPEFNRR